MKTGPKNIAIDMALVREDALRMIGESTSRVAPPVIEKKLVERYDLTKKEAKNVIRGLVSDGELAYTYEFGTSFLELSFNRPVRVSNHVVLKPPGHHFRPEAEDVVITIKPGAAFGDGRHPTSRLAVRGIEYVLKEARAFRAEDSTRALDVGTGSGILVITAVQMGVQAGLGIDIDSSARAEAAENVSLNRLGHRIEISDQALEAIEGPFDLVAANLRYPTLIKICAALGKLTRPEGIIVCSGIRSHELMDLIRAYKAIGFLPVWQDQSHEWAGVGLKNLV